MRLRRSLGAPVIWSGTTLALPGACAPAADGTAASPTPAASAIHHRRTLTASPSLGRPVAGTLRPARGRLTRPMSETGAARRDRCRTRMDAEQPRELEPEVQRQPVGA